MSTLTIVDKSYEAIISEADIYLNSGQTDKAVLHFFAAFLMRPTACEPLQLVGVCLRMLGHLDVADCAFRSAAKLASTYFQAGKIYRDWSVVEVRHHNYHAALTYLKVSRCLLEYRPINIDGTPRTNEEEDAYEREYFMTLSFMGDVYRLRGDRSRAKAYTKLSWRILKGDHPYELNALMRYLRTVHLPYRLLLARRAWQLASQANNKKRKFQIIALLISVKWVDKRTR